MAAMRNMRIAALVLVLIGAGLLYAGSTGAVDDLIVHNCGGAGYRPDCAPDEASPVLKLVGGIFIAVAALMVFLSYALAGRVTEPLTTSIDPASIPVWNAPTGVRMRTLGITRRRSSSCRS